MYKSKIFSFEVMLSIIFSLIFIGISTLFTFSPVHTKNPALFPLFLFLIPLAFLYPIIKRAAIIKINENELIIKYLFRKIILNSVDIESIELIARKNSTLFDAEYRLNGIEIIEKSGLIYFLPDKYIGSKSELKTFLKAFSLNNSIRIILPDRKKMIPKFENYESSKYAGNYITSYMGIMLIGMITFFLWVLLYSQPNKNENAGIILLIISGFLYLIFGFSANYFIVKENTLIVKNHLFFWKSKKFSLDNILEITLEERQKSSNQLNIIFNDFSSKRYFAGSLRDKHWMALKEKFEEYGIPVISDFTF